MRSKVFSLLFFLIAVTCSKRSVAGHIIRKQTETTAVTAAVSNLQNTKNTNQSENLISTIKYLTKADAAKPSYSPGDSGWAGIVALCCGVLGCFLGWPAILAIIFGAIGMGRNKRYKGLAITGFVLGLVITVFLLAALLFAFAIFGMLL